MTNKGNILLYIAVAVVVMAFFKLNPLVSGISVVLIGLIIIGLELLNVLQNIPVLNSLSGRTNKGTLAVLFIAGLVFGGYLGNLAIGNPLSADISNYKSGYVPDQDSYRSGNSQSAKFVFYPTSQNGGTYAGSGVIYLLDPAVAPNRYSFMKILADGNTGQLKAPGGIAQASSISVSSGAFTKNQLTMAPGSKIAVCGYFDTTPAAAENVSFCNAATLNGVTGGSTPEWMWSFDNLGSSEYTWRNYATTAFYDSTETARTAYVESQASAIERSFSFLTFPTNNGESLVNGVLYFEAPAANAGAIKSIKITGPSGLSKTYSTLQSTSQMATTDPRFIASPALTTSTDTMYYVGAFPEDATRTSTSEKAKFTIEAIYTHPASGVVNTYFKAVQNADALTSTGGHFDFGTTMNLNMSAVGTSAWS